MKVLREGKSAEIPLKIDRSGQCTISQEVTQRITLPFSAPKTLANRTVEEISYFSGILNACIKAIEPIVAVEMFLKNHYEWWLWKNRKLTVTKDSRLTQKIPQIKEESFSSPKQLHLVPFADEDLGEDQKFSLPLPSPFWTRKQQKKQRKKKKNLQERED